MVPLVGHTPLILTVVCGTDTGVGKTWVTAKIIESLHEHNINAYARKPAQSFSAGETTDAEILGLANGESPEQVCPINRWYPIPMAPPIAAEVLNKPVFSLQDLVDELQWPLNTAVGMVETVGGVYSPLADNGDVADFCSMLQPELVILVSDARLGTINITRLSIEALQMSLAKVRRNTSSSYETPLFLFLNRYNPYDELHKRNCMWLSNWLTDTRTNKKITKRSNSNVSIFVETEELVKRLLEQVSRRPLTAVDKRWGKDER